MVIQALPFFSVIAFIIVVINIIIITYMSYYSRREQYFKL